MFTKKGSPSGKDKVKDKVKTKNKDKSKKKTEFTTPMSDENILPYINDSHAKLKTYVHAEEKLEAFKNSANLDEKEYYRAVTAMHQAFSEGSEAVKPQEKITALKEAARATRVLAQGQLSSLDIAKARSNAYSNVGSPCAVIGLILTLTALGIILFIPPALPVAAVILLVAFVFAGIAGVTVLPTAWHSPGKAEYSAVKDTLESCTKCENELNELNELEKNLKENQKEPPVEAEQKKQIDQPKVSNNPSGMFSKPTTGDNTRKDGNPKPSAPPENAFDNPKETETKETPKPGNAG